MSRRQIMRHCKAGTFDAQKLPATNNVEEWFIPPRAGAFMRSRLMQYCSGPPMEDHSDVDIQSS